GGPDQLRLLEYLFNNTRYKPISRPVQNDSQTLPVTINLALQQIINFDGKNEAIVISGWMTIMWNDYGLGWKPEEFGNIETLRIPSTQIWTPDIFLYNTADENFDAAVKVNAVVRYSGDILYVPPVLFKSSCPFNIAAFPFVTIKKKLPCFLISCMTLLGLVLPPDSGDKINLQITTLLTVVMFSLLLSEIMPPSSHAIPIITVYFMCVMIMSVVSVIASVLVLSLHFRNSKNSAMSVWIRKYICNYLAWLLCMKRPNHDLSWCAIRRRLTSPKQESHNINQLIADDYSKIPSEPLFKNTFELLSTNGLNIDSESLEFQANLEKQRSVSLLEFAVPSTTTSHRSYHHQNTLKELNRSNMEMIHAELRTIISQLAILTSHFRQQEKDDDESQEWKFVARVIDRLCLVVFAVSMTLFTTLIFLNA
ncbi:unnamed protein product, partial [Rotaria sp. Silwood2]